MGPITSLTQSLETYDPKYDTIQSALLNGSFFYAVHEYWFDEHTGDVELSGKQLRACAKRAGFGAGHRVHGVGDGAPWIAKQMKQRFGSQGSYLLDFYHVCEYLDAAAKAIEAEPKARTASG